MTRGKKKENIGPCKICGCENTTEIYRKLNTNTLAEAYKGPEAHLLPTKSSNKRKESRDLAYHKSGGSQKRVCLSQNTYEQLINKEVTIEQLQQQIEQLKSELNDYDIMIKEAQISEPLRFCQFFDDQISRMTKILYDYQRDGKPVILDVQEFIKLIESRDSKLKSFFNTIFKAMNPAGKSHKTIQSLKQKVMLLCYQMATLRNKHVSSVKNSIGIFLAGSGTSVTGINSIAGMGLSSTYQTVYNQIKDILNNHNTSVCNYIQENSNNLFILNIDDYHNLHQSRIPSTTSISQVSHMATILINYIKTSPVSYNFNSEFNVHNINGVDAGLLNQWLNKKYMNIISESYYQRKTKWNFVKDLTTIDEDNLIDSLVLHSYDAYLTEKHSKRSFNSTKLIEFLPQDLKNTNDYLKSLGEFFRIPEIQKYLETYLIPIPADFPGQLYIRRAIVQKLKLQECSTIPNEITHLVPFLGPLHVALNTKESVFLTFWAFFNEMFKATFQSKRNLAAKPKPWRINLLLYMAHAGWKIVRNHVFQRFGQNKDLGYCTFVDLLDTLVPSTLDIYAVLFWGNHFEEYVETIFRLWAVMCRFQRKNYNKIMLAFLSDIHYWTQINHPILQILKSHLNYFDEYPVENFHSLVRRHTTAKVLSPEWLRRDGIFVDYLRHDNNFAQSFAEKKSYPYSKKNIDVLVKQTAIFLLKFFNNLWNNLGTVEIRSEGKKIKKPYWYFQELQKDLLKDLAALYNERLEMDGNIGDEFDSPQDETIEEDDTNIPETISLGDKLDKCLHKTLRAIGYFPTN
uniref:Uncharacterized protein n=1 Tax=Rhizophagus irregularis (strain DAOM 181602 / DAOM 197198 / MUCL 43194) TaxID=747089 RepID=U9ULY4_RHIID